MGIFVWENFYLIFVLIIFLWSMQIQFLDLNDFEYFRYHILIHWKFNIRELISDNLWLFSYDVFSSENILINYHIPASWMIFWDFSRFFLKNTSKLKKIYRQWGIFNPKSLSSYLRPFLIQHLTKFLTK